MLNNDSNFQITIWAIYGPCFFKIPVLYITWGYVNLSSLASVTGKCPNRFLALKRIGKLIDQLCGQYPAGTTLMVEVPRAVQSPPEIWVHPVIAEEFVVRCAFPTLLEWFRKNVFHKALRHPDSVFLPESHSKWPTVRGPICHHLC